MEYNNTGETLITAGKARIKLISQKYLFARWLIFQPKYSLADVFELAPAIKMFCLSGHLQWNTDGSLRATEKGLNVVDSILPNILTVLNEFYDKNKLEICRYLKLFIHATLSSMNHQ